MTMGRLRATVILRDERCVISVVDPTHHCFDRAGQRHRPDDLEALTLGHVREHPGGKRRDEPGWCIAQCWRSNDRHEESANAAAVRIYLAGVRAGMRS